MGRLLHICPGHTWAPHSFKDQGPHLAGGVLAELAIEVGPRGQGQGQVCCWAGLDKPPECLWVSRQGGAHVS